MKCVQCRRKCKVVRCERMCVCSNAENHYEHHYRPISNPRDLTVREECHLRSKTSRQTQTGTISKQTRKLQARKKNLELPETTTTESETSVSTQQSIFGSLNNHKKLFH